MSSDVRADPIVRCFIILASCQTLHSTDSYQDVYDRIVAARDATVLMTEDKMGNPLSLPLVNVRAVLRNPDDEDAPFVVDACFNPAHLVMMYRSHPDV